jgi:soluble lytic murein transglycosylase-like protein
MTRGIAMLALGTLALAPGLGLAGETFACKDAEGNWVLGNVEQHRCVGKVRKVTQGAPGTPRARRVPSASGAWDEARAILQAPPEYRQHIRDAAEKYRLSEELLHAVMFVESGFRPTAVSEKGAMGLMQLMPGTAKDMYVRDPWSPSENIDGGARYLRTLANQYDGDLIRTLAAYNAGPEAVKRAGGVPGIPETQDYVQRVLKLYEKLRTRNASGGKGAERRDG